MLHSGFKNCFFLVLPITYFWRSNNCCTYVRKYMQQTVWAFQSPSLCMSNCNKVMLSNVVILLSYEPFDQQNWNYRDSPDISFIFVTTYFSNDKSCIKTRTRQELGGNIDQIPGRLLWTGHLWRVPVDSDIFFRSLCTILFYIGNQP